MAWQYNISYFAHICHLKLCEFPSSGYNGWFPINIPVRGWASEETDPAGHQQDENGLNRVGGGIEISIKFAHHEDRERVIHAARGVGWSPVDLDVEQDGWQSEGIFPVIEQKIWYRNIRTV